MTDKKTPSFLTLEDRFPYCEKRLEEAFTENKIRELSMSVAEGLKAIISLEQLSNDYLDPEAKGTSAEIHRIEQKLDFVTELLARVLHAQQDIPETNAIKMSAEHISWYPQISLCPGDYCVLSIYLSQKYPLPIDLPVEVINSNAKELSVFQTEGRILLSDENIIEDLTRLIFLFHRRQIARNRSQS